MLTQIEAQYKENDTDNQEFKDVSEFFEKKVQGEQAENVESPNEMY